MGTFVAVSLLFTTEREREGGNPQKHKQDGTVVAIYKRYCKRYIHPHASEVIIHFGEAPDYFVVKRCDGIGFSLSSFLPVNCSTLEMCSVVCQETIQKAETAKNKALSCRSNREAESLSLFEHNYHLGTLQERCRTCLQHVSMVCWHSSHSLPSFSNLASSSAQGTGSSWACCTCPWTCPCFAKPNMF